MNIQTLRQTEVTADYDSYILTAGGVVVNALDISLNKKTFMSLPLHD